MHNAHQQLKLSYQRAISPDYQGFFTRFYEKFTGSDPGVKQLFETVDMERQYQMLMASMTHMISFAPDQEPGAEMERMAMIHGKDRLAIPAHYYDLWLDSLIETLRERDPKFNDHIENAWKKVLMPGIDYMKSFCP